MNLIEKTSLQNRKPGFKWLGHTGFLEFITTQRQKALAKSEASTISEKEPNKKLFKTDRVFMVSRGLPIAVHRVANAAPQVMAPVARRFAPLPTTVPRFVPPIRLMPVHVPLKMVPQPEKKRIKLDDDDHNKENVNREIKINLEKSGAFTRLDLLLQVVKKMEGKVQGKNLKKRPLMESQTINIVP